MCVGGCGWGNPWLISDRLPRATAVTLFARYLLSTPSHIARARLELRGRELACSSGRRGRLCHGHVLAEVANCSQQRLEQLAAWAAAGPPVASPPTAPAPPKWWTERKPTVQERARSGAVCASCDASGGCYTFEVAFDMKKWFHQWFLRTTEVWKSSGMSPGQDEHGNISDDLSFIRTLVMTIGTSPSSNIAQRAMNELARILIARMCAYEEAQFHELSECESQGM